MYQVVYWVNKDKKELYLTPFSSLLGAQIALRRLKEDVPILWGKIEQV